MRGKTPRFFHFQNGVLKNMKRILIYAIMLLLFLPFVCAYEQLGGNNSQFLIEGTGYYNDQLSETCGTDIVCTAKNLASPNVVPMVSDLDSDGINEIIAVDGVNIRLYQTSSLTILDAYSSSVTITSMYIYDIDGDSLKEIIVAGNNDMEIVQWNGTDMSADVTFANGLTGYETGTPNIAIACVDTDNCLVIYEEREAGAVGNSGAIEYATFNSTNIVNLGEIDASANNDVICLSNIPEMQTADIDGDGYTEYIASAGDVDDGKIHLYVIYVNSTNNLTVEQTGTRTMRSLTDSCDTSSTYFTSPLVFDIDGASSDGLEIVAGYQIDSDEFEMASFSKTCAFEDEYPEVFDSDGIILSNPFRANAFPDTGDVDFCVMGYDTADGFLDLTCASEQTGNLVETEEFKSNVAPAEVLTFNVTAGYHSVAHAVQTSVQTTDGTNLHEVLTAYGVWELEWAGFFGSVNRLDLIWENPKGDSAVIMSDVENVGKNDVLALTSTNLWYIDDGFTNSVAEIDEYTINPCIDATWKVNTTVSVQLTIEDFDDDDVAGRIKFFSAYPTTVLYDSGWSINASSGTTFSFGFTANETTSNGGLVMYATDVENYGDNTSIGIYPVSVSTSGVEYGDCITTETGIIDYEDAVDNGSIPSALSQDEKATVRSAILGSGAIDSSYAPIVALIFIVVAVLVPLSYMIQNRVQNTNALVMIPAICSVAVWIVMVYFEMLPAWTVVVAILLGSAFIGWRVYERQSVGGI